MIVPHWHMQSLQAMCPFHGCLGADSFRCVLSQTVNRQEEELRELRSMASTSNNRSAHPDTTSISTPASDKAHPHQLARPHAHTMHANQRAPQHRIPQHLHPQQQLHMRPRPHARRADPIEQRRKSLEQSTPASSPRLTSMDTGGAVTPRTAKVVQVNGQAMSVSPFALQSYVPEGQGSSDEENSAKGGF